MAKRIATNMEVKKSNRNQIFRYLCRCERISNPDIAYELKLSLPTVMQNTKELMERGLVKEAGELQSTGGRRAKALLVEKNAHFAVGLDITKHHVGFLLTNLVGEILQYQRLSIPYCAEDGYGHKLSQTMETFLKDSGVDKEKVLGVGISFPGIVDLKQEMITDSHVLGVKSIPFAQVSRFFSYPCLFLNDANAGAFAEGLRVQGEERFFYLSLSNTVGGALFEERKLVQGQAFRCGEVGHMTLYPNGKVCYCGKQGCTDTYCSAKVLTHDTAGNLEQFFLLLEQGETGAQHLWQQYIHDLAVVVNNLHMILDCDIVLGGYVGSHLGPYLEELWAEVVKRNTFAEQQCFIRPCSYRVEISALGAALRVIEDFIEQV